MPLSESSLINTFRGWMLQSLDFKPSIERYRLAKRHLREITPSRESLVWWQCLSSDSRSVLGKEDSHPLGQCGARRPYVATDRHRAVGVHTSSSVLPRPKAHTNTGFFVVTLERSLLKWTLSTSAACFFLLISPQLLDHCVHDEYKI